MTLRHGRILKQDKNYTNHKRLINLAISDFRKE